MNRTTIIAAFFALVFLGGQCALAQSGYNLFQKGLVQERVKGDLDEAIKIYDRIIVKFPKDRPIVAKALLHIGLCYEKMGKQEALKHYQHLIKEYGDQAEPVAQARVRLSKLNAADDKAASAMSTRQVWAPVPDMSGGPSPDGRYFSYVNWGNGNLAVHDLRSGENRDLTDEATFENQWEYCDASIWSPDSRQVGYCWLKGEGAELRIVNLDGSKPRVLCGSGLEGGHAPWPRDWSQDGKHILAILTKKGGSPEHGHEHHIVLVSVADGSWGILKSLGERHTQLMSLSPDGRHVVFELTTEDPKKRDIYLLATDGSGEAPLVEHPADDRAPFWTPDGKRIVFASDRSGARALWMLEVDEGKPKGAPTKVKEVFWPKGFAADGSFYYGVQTMNRDVFVATLDFEAGKVLAPPVKISLHPEGYSYAPAWSPDGNYLAYISGRTSSTGPVYAIQSVETGQERYLSPEIDLKGPGWAVTRWSPDGASLLLTHGRDMKGNRGLHSIDAETGKASMIVKADIGSLSGPVISSDGKQIYCIRGDLSGDLSIIIHNLKTHEERELCRANASTRNLAISPDGRRLAFFEGEAWVRPTVVKTISTSGGQPNELYTLKKGKSFNRGVGLSWMPDGNHVVVGAPEAPDKPDELWIIPAEGGEPRKLELGVKVNNFALHPDGRRIAFTRREPGGGGEVWVMENFLPESKAGE